jgi:hypothetical protein
MRAEQPMRLSVQLRAGDGASDRWASSVYLDSSDQTHTVFFDDMTPVDHTRTLEPPLASVRSLLFVIDTTNTKPGASGRIWMKRAVLEK